MRILNPGAESKHKGHAVEGHLKGLLLHLPDVTADNLSRTLPFEFPLEEDLVLTDARGLIRAVFIITYWTTKHNSDSKLHRTRLEYNELLSQLYENQEVFADEFRILTVVYGTEDGWKPMVLESLRIDCPTLVFLPEIIGADSAEVLVDRAFGIYKEAWAHDALGATESVSQVVASDRLSSLEEQLLTCIESLLASKDSVNLAIKTSRSTNVRLPPPIHTRFRQGLGIASLFPDDELACLKDYDDISDEALGDAVRRSVFLDVADVFTVVTGIRSKRIAFELRKPFRSERGKIRYAPDLPDFDGWRLMPSPARIWTLARHRLKTNNPTSTFESGASDQCCGNWRMFCSLVIDGMPGLITALRGSHLEDAYRILHNEVPLVAEDWHPAYGFSFHRPLWSLLVCAIATADGDRRIRGELFARRSEPPDREEVRELVSEWRRSGASLDQLQDVVDYAVVLLNGDLSELANSKRPMLLQRQEKCSWTADIYNTLTTNWSHNPICGIVEEWLKRRFQDLKWLGWPDIASCPLSKVFPKSKERRKWQFLGIDSSRKHCIAVEVKSVTQNNWGNKSKELYDRVAITRKVFSANGWQCVTICILDGDIDLPVMQELSTGIGHDEYYSIFELIEELEEGSTFAQ